MKNSWLKTVKERLNNHNLAFAHDGAEMYYLLTQAWADQEEDDHFVPDCYLSNFEKINFLPTLQQDHTLNLAHTYDYIVRQLRGFGDFELAVDNQLLAALEQKEIAQAEKAGHKDAAKIADVEKHSYRVVLLDARQDAIDNYNLFNADMALQVAHTAVLFINNRSEYFFLEPCAFNLAAHPEINEQHLPVIKTTVKQIQDLAKPLAIRYQNRYFVNTCPFLDRFDIATGMNFDSDRVQAVYEGVVHPYALLLRLYPVDDDVTLDTAKKYKQQEMFVALCQNSQAAD